MPPHNIRAFLFDLDGTLLFSRPSGFQAFLQYGRDLGLSFTPEAERATERWQHQLWADRETVTGLFTSLGQVKGWQEITRRQLARLGITGALEDYVTAIHARFDTDYQPQSLVPPEVPETLAELRRRGYVTGLVSNRDDPLGPAAETHGLAGLFDFTLAAGEAGHWKPHRAIFERALVIAGVPAEAAAYVGDNFYADIVGSKAAGLHPVLYDPTGLFPEADCRVILSLTELLEL